MSDELQLKITLDTGEVVQGILNVEKTAKKSAKNIEDNFDKSAEGIKESLQSLAPQTFAIGERIGTALLSPLGLVAESVAALGVAAKSAFDMTLAGEKLNKIDKQFDSLAHSVGIAGDALKTKFIGSLGGLTDDASAIQSLNKAFVTLGEKVTQLPQIMLLARKATSLFGGEVADNFETINQAIATGATRQLRGLGIIINSDQAYTKYAKSIGITKDLLSESGRQQAILNEVIAKGEERFGAIAVKTNTLTTALKELSVESANRFDEFEKNFAKAFGPAAVRVIDYFKEKIKGGFDLTDAAMTLLSLPLQLNKIAIEAGAAAFGLTEASKSIDDIKKSISDTEGDLSGFQKRLDQLNDLKSGSTDKAFIDKINANIELVKIKSKGATKDLQDLFAQLSKKIGPEDLSTVLPSRARPTVAGDSVDQVLLAAATKKREKELTDFLLQQDQARLNSSIQTNVIKLNNVLTNAQRLSLTTSNLDIQDKLREEQKNQQIVAIKEKYRAEELTGSEYEKKALLAIDQNYNQQKIQADTNREQQLKILREQAMLEQLSGLAQLSYEYDLFFKGFHESAVKFVATESESFKKLGEEIFNSLGNRIGAAFTAFGSALRKGQDAGKAFTKVMVEQIAQIASQIGNFFIQLGIARLAASYGADGSGYALIAAGAAIDVIGGMLSASVGGGDSGANTGGGTASEPSSSTNLTPVQNTTKQEPNTQVQVVVQGNIMDSDESASRIVDLINQAFDKKGVVIQRGAVA